MGALGKPFKKKSDGKIEKTGRKNVKMSHANKKTLDRKLIFVRTPFFHSILKLELTHFTPQNHSFSLHFQIRRDQNHYSNLISKTMNIKEYL